MRFLLSGVENNSHYSHWHALFSHAHHGGDESDAHKALCIGEGCVPRSRFRIHPPRANGNQRRRVSTPRWCSLFLPAGVFLSYPFHSPYAYKTRGWDARRNAAILLQINHARIVAVASVVAGAIVLPRFVSLGLANCLPTPLAGNASRTDGTGLLHRTQFFRAGASTLGLSTRVD